MSLYDEVVASLTDWQSIDGVLHPSEISDTRIVLVTPEDMSITARAEITRRVAKLLEERGWHCTRSRTRVTVEDCDDAQARQRLTVAPPRPRRTSRSRKPRPHLDTER